MAFLDMKKILSISFLELKRSRKVAKKKLVIITMILGMLIYLSVNLLVNSGYGSNEKFYTVFTQDSEIKNLIVESDKFVLVEDANADIVVEVSDKITVFSSGTDRAKAALYNFEELIKLNNKLVLLNYSHEDAYPLWVDVEMLDREDSFMGSEFDGNIDSNLNSDDNPNNAIKLSNRKKETAAEILNQKSDDANLELEDGQIPLKNVDVYDVPNMHPDNVDELNLNDDSMMDDGLVNDESINKNDAVVNDVVVEEELIGTDISVRDIIDENDVIENENNIENKNDIKTAKVDNNDFDSYVVGDESTGMIKNVPKSVGGFTERELNLPEKLNPFDQLKVLFMVIFITVPVSMISMIYSNSLMAEKINKRGIFLLLAPIKKIEIIIGKTLPYFLSSFLASLVIIFRSTFNPIEILMASLIVISVLLIYLGIAFMCSILARSHRELSFLSIFCLSLYSCYLLIPTFMLNISVISLASPLTVVAKIFQHELIAPKTFFFALFPNLIASFSLFYFGSKILNDENMFGYRKIGEKIIDGFKTILQKSYWNLALISFVSIPFIYLVQLMIMVFLMSLPSFNTYFLLVLFSALVEEFFRNIGVYTILRKRLYKKKLKYLLLYSFITALGFFIAEKGLFLLTLSPFLDAYSAINFSGGLSLIIPMLAVLIGITFFIHLFLTFSFALVYKHYKSYSAALFVSTVIHFLINVSTRFVILTAAGALM